MFLAACGPQAAEPANEAAVAPPAAKPAAPSKPFAFDEENDLMEFHFGWSAEAAAVPQLVQQFRREMKMERAGLQQQAKASKALRDEQGFPYQPLSSSIEYRTAGQSDRLLVLAGEVASYTGGAHGNFGTKTMLWDRREAREVGLGDIFSSIENMDRLLTQRWCDALNKAREEKRGEPVGAGGLFDECPDFTEVGIIPTDKDRNGRFERLTLVADPYVAGPYVEGEYQIELAVTGDLIAAIRSDYRNGFEVQPQ